MTNSYCTFADRRPLIGTFEPLVNNVSDTEFPLKEGDLVITPHCVDKNSKVSILLTVNRIHGTFGNLYVYIKGYGSVTIDGMFKLIQT